MFMCSNTVKTCVRTKPVCLYTTIVHYSNSQTPMTISSHTHGLMGGLFFHCWIKLSRPRANLSACLSQSNGLSPPPKFLWYCHKTNKQIVVILRSLLIFKREIFKVTRMHHYKTTVRIGFSKTALLPEMSNSYSLWALNSLRKPQTSPFLKRGRGGAREHSWN